MNENSRSSIDELHRRALITLLIDKGIITKEEYFHRIIALKNDVIAKSDGIKEEDIRALEEFEETLREILR